MTLTRLSGAKSLRDPLLSQLLGEWVASSPLAKGRWYEATEVAQLPLIRYKQIEAVEQYASVLFPAPEMIGLRMDLNVPKGGFRHVSEFMTRRGGACTATTRLPFSHPIPSRDRFMDTWKELVKPLALDRPVSVADPPTSGRSWPLLSWARNIPLCPPLVDTIHWKRPLTFLLRGDAYPVEVGPNFPLGSSMVARRCYQETCLSLENGRCVGDPHVVVERCLVFLCVLHCCMAMGRLQVAFIQARLGDLPKDKAVAVQRVLYRARTGVRLGASASPDREETQALFRAWEELWPLLAYAPEDGEWQAVVAMRNLLRDLYSDTAPRADLRAAEIARAYRLYCCKAACQSNYLFYLEQDVTLVVADAARFGVALGAVCADVAESLNAILKWA